MADTKTWIDVADTAVKIGLGALVGGLSGVWLAKLNNKHAVLTSRKERKREILEEILELTDSFSQSVTTFWANRANAAWKIENNRELTEDERQELASQERKLFSDFTIINTCKAKLSLIGAKDAGEKLSEYRKPIDDFFKIASIHNATCTEEKLMELKDIISRTRMAFFESLNLEYEK